MKDYEISPLLTYFLDPPLLQPMHIDLMADSLSALSACFSVSLCFLSNQTEVTRDGSVQNIRGCRRTYERKH
jgi:hypothetical protein